MTRKFIIVFVITTLFTALVVGFSWFYLSQLLRQRLQWADETASQLTNQLEYAASKAVPDLTSTRVDTENPKAMRLAVSNYLQTDTNLNDMLESGGGKFSHHLRRCHPRSQWGRDSRHKSRPEWQGPTATAGLKRLA